MRSFILLTLLLFVSLLSAAAYERYDTHAAGLNARVENLRLAPAEVSEPGEDDEFVSHTAISKTFALPYQAATLNISRSLWNVFDENGNFLYTESNRNHDMINLANSFTMREMRGFTVVIETQVLRDGKIYTLKDVDFALAGSQPIVMPTSVSPAFIDAYKVLADNFETSYLRNLPVARPKMLILSHTNLASYQNDYINWKRSIGFDVYVAYKSQIGTTLDHYIQFIQNHWNENHCDYLMLLGDVTGNYSIPTAFFPSPEYAENDADDHQYALLDGDDYFPEMLVGRFSFNDISEFMTMANKTVVYERSPFMSNPAWMKRGLAVAGNYAEGGLRPITPVQMSRWLRNRMLDYGYTQVDTVFYPPTYPGTQSIISAINQGVQIISYRGWGDANGWHYPSFHIPDLNNTFNGPRMPIVFSIVCNTGDFANSVNPSFGEKWMRMGSVAQPGGAIAFVGPSDLHTKTRYNNSISSGAFRSIYDYGVRGFGTSVLIGKIELYKNFPNDLAPNQYVAFYYHVYNLLSDPSLNMWILEPSTISSNVIQGGLTYAQSASHIRISAPHLENAMVSGTKNQTTYSYAVVKNGYAILPVNPEESGNLVVTISKPNFVPLVATMTPSAAATIGITVNSLIETTINPATSHTLQLTFKNYSSGNYSNINVSLINIEGVSIANPTQTITTLAAGATTTLSFNLTAGANIQPRDLLHFDVNITNPATNHSFQLVAGGAEFTVVDASGILHLGVSSPVVISVINTGNVALTNAGVQIVSLTEAAVIGSGLINIGTVAVGETKQFTANIQVASGAWHGRNIPIKLLISGSGYSTTAFYALTAGTPATTSPTGPCPYGYYAYDSFDAGFAQTPTYNWIELDPLLGGQGNLWLIMDDGSRTVDLPFNFRFYGRNYNHVTMCSNGWISLLPTDMEDFYNHYIPAALGPYAMIAGYWDDLKGRKTGVDPDGNPIFANMRILYWFDAANNRYIVQWNDAYNQYTINSNTPSLEKFQIILYPQQDRDGDIVVQYHTVDNPGTTTNYCTVGIENHSQTVGLSYTHANFYPPTATPLQAGLAIKFTTIPPDNYVSNDDHIIQKPFELLQNYPNPFNPTTTIAFNAAQGGNAKLMIYNIKGQVVKTLLESDVARGKHSIIWNGTDDGGKAVGSGLYFYSLSINGNSQTRKMLLLK
ncbi:MAG: C25 family cysteine peptidase [Candidatus Cloacimonadaceae bacterium]|nr:C25 family cysteine peptidase [Candidatus Cloacimonadaceae bacterium]